MNKQSRQKAYVTWEYGVPEWKQVELKGYSTTDPPAIGKWCRDSGWEWDRCMTLGAPDSAVSVGVHRRSVCTQGLSPYAYFTELYLGVEPVLVFFTGAQSLIQFLEGLAPLLGVSQQQSAAGVSQWLIDEEKAS